MRLQRGWRQVGRLKGGRLGTQLASLRRALAGGPGLALLSALMLAGYWLGGPGVLLVAGMVGPAVLALISLGRSGQGADGEEPSSASASDEGSGRAPGPPPIQPAMLGAQAALAAVQADPAAGRPGPRRALCVLLELDGFAELETRHGAAAARLVPMRMAERLQAATRRSDTLSALGAGRFALVLPGIPEPALEVAIEICARLLASVAEPLFLDGERLQFTACAGFTVISSGAEPEQLLQAAEAALAEARRQGPGSIRAHVAGTPLRPPLTECLVPEVAQGLESGAIQAFFQPQLSTDTGEVIGMEALARWLHPVRGTLLPGEFLPAIAAAGLMRRLGTQMLSHALGALCEWERRGLRVPTVSVNLDEGELSDPTLPERIRWELDRWNLAPARLIVEVLETVLATGANALLDRNLAHLCEMGVGIDLDDFGTGAASLAAIRSFRVHRIKIDRSFVTRLDQDRGQQDMVAAILSMAERLGLPTLAEGVETPAEHALLAQLGCNAVQGFGIAKPMPLDATFAWIRESRKSAASARAIGRKVI